MKLVGLVLMMFMIGTALVFESCTAVSLCNMDEGGILACKPSVTNPNPVDPSADCCKALSGANLTCLCSYKNSLFLPSLGIDPHLALALPAKCNLPSPSDC